MITEPVSPYPVSVEGELGESLSRWLGLVKWILILPHFIVLIFLWIAFSIIALIHCPRLP